jgi:glycosyltransferase involved in cell wall biosynthesis
VLGINYRGDPHAYPYPIYAAGVEGDGFGIERIVWMCDLVKPDVIVVQNDPWNIPSYLKRLKAFYPSVPVIGIIAVDGKNCAGRGLNGLSLAIFWTEFGLDEARAGGYTGPAVVIPLGVDMKTYYPMDKYDARLRRGLPKELDDAFIVGNVNRNQPRKRWDLTIKYFAEWVHNGPLKDAYLYLHVAPTGDMGIQVQALAAYYGILQRILVMEPRTFYGLPEDEMRNTYNCFDVQISTTQGEGFGLTTFEGMACGVPQIVPDWSALGELCKGSARLVPCTSTAIGPPYVNVIGGVADERMFVKEIDALYKNRALREQTALDGLARTAEDRFRWANIGEQVRLVTGHIVACTEFDREERRSRDAAAYAEAERVALGLGGGMLVSA